MNTHQSHQSISADSIRPTAAIGDESRPARQLQPVKSLVDLTHLVSRFRDPNVAYDPYLDVVQHLCLHGDFMRAQRVIKAMTDAAPLYLGYEILKIAALVKGEIDLAELAAAEAATHLKKVGSQSLLRPQP